MAAIPILHSRFLDWCSGHLQFTFCWYQKYQKNRKTTLLEHLRFCVSHIKVWCFCLMKRSWNILLVSSKNWQNGFICLVHGCYSYSWQTWPPNVAVLLIFNCFIYIVNMLCWWSLPWMVKSVRFSFWNPTRKQTLIAQVSSHQSVSHHKSLYGFPFQMI